MDKANFETDAQELGICSVDTALPSLSLDVTNFNV
jgi:hypothetical protein